MLRGTESSGGRFSSPPNKFDLSPLNCISYGGLPTAGTAQLGGFQRLQRARSLFLLAIRESNQLWWFMSHHSILWLTNLHRRHRS